MGRLLAVMALACTFGAAMGQTPNKESADFTEMGVTAYLSKDFNTAVIHFTKAIDLDPKNSRAHSGRGYALNNTSKFPESLADLNKSIELNPNPKTRDVYLVRGTIYNRMSKHDEAIADFNKVIELDPKNANAYIYRSSSYLSKKMYPRAIEDCTKAIEIDPTNANAFASRAGAYASSEQFDESYADCRKALELDPKNELANTMARLGSKMIDSKLKQRALQNEAKRLQQLLDNTKEEPARDMEGSAASYKNGKASFNKKDYKSAIVDFTKAIELNPKDPDCYALRAKAYSLLKKHTEAIADCDKAIDLGVKGPSTAALRKLSEQALADAK